MTAVLLIAIIGGIPLAAIIWMVVDVIRYPAGETVHPYNWEDDGGMPM